MPQSYRRIVLYPVILILSLAGAFLVPTAAGAKPRTAAVSLGDRTLKPGTKGADVKELQQLLSTVGIEVDVDGKYGPAVAKAVARFQRAANLGASGNADRVTIQALRRAAAGGSASSLAGGFDPAMGDSRTQSLGDRIPVRQGMSGHDVKVLQDFLRRLGYKVTVDGEYGSTTTKAVRRFESASALSSDGVVDAADITAIRGQIDPAAVSTGDITTGGDVDTSGASGAPQALGPGDRATVGADGLAVAPASAPEAVKQIIAAGNAIAKLPYKYGGGHGKWQDSGYDCSGSVSFALHGADLLDSALVSGDFPGWGESGPGQWVTIYGNTGHVYMVVAGLRFDTSGAKQDGSRWHKSSRPTSGFGVSHPKGL